MIATGPAIPLTKNELLAQSLARHHLLQRADRIEVASDLCGLQAQFATGPRLRPLEA